MTTNKTVEDNMKPKVKASLTNNMPMTTPKEIVLHLTMFAHFSGNWQKPIGPKDTQIYVKAIEALITEAELKARKNEVGMINMGDNEYPAKRLTQLRDNE